MKIKTEIQLTAREVNAVIFYAAFHGPRRSGADVESSLNENEKALYELGEKIDRKVRENCGGSRLPKFWTDENKNGGVFTYIHPRRI